MFALMVAPIRGSRTAKGCRRGSSSSANGEAPLHASIQAGGNCGKVAVAEALLAGSADPCIRDSAGLLPLLDCHRRVHLAGRERCRLAGIRGCHVPEWANCRVFAHPGAKASPGAAAGGPAERRGRARCWSLLLK